VTRFLMPVEKRSTDVGGNHGQGLLAIPHGPDLATSCAGGRLIGPLSWLQVQGREEPHHFNGASAGGIDRRNQILRQNWSWDRSVGVRSAQRPQVRVERELIWLIIVVRPALWLCRLPRASVFFELVVSSLSCTHTRATRLASSTVVRSFFVVVFNSAAVPVPVVAAIAIILPHEHWDRVCFAPFAALLVRRERVG